MLAQFLVSLQKANTTDGPFSRRAGALLTQDVEVRKALASIPKSFDIHSLTTISGKVPTGPSVGQTTGVDSWRLATN